MPKINFYDRIKESTLTKKEEQFVNQLMSNVNKVAFLNGAKMASEFGVSPSLITRFIKKLGYAGFSEFKKDLESIYKKNNTPHDRFEKIIQTKDLKEGIVQSTFAQDLNNLINMQESMDEEAIEKACLQIENAENVYISALFTSEICAHLLSFYLNRLGINNVTFLGIGLSKKVEYCRMTEKDVFIAISSMGYLNEIIEAAKIARSEGSITISITNDNVNVLARTCDLNLVAPGIGTAIDYSQIAPISMINIIANKIAGDRSEEVLENLAKEKESWFKFYAFGVDKSFPR
ncbi:MAG TPA: hypothetical protein DHN33_11910 [Eubacteriaceae bacterium]|nr:hypothetical protein [Eubacteriaceae bacterium]